MAGKKFDAVGIGNAIVDVIASADEAFIQKMGLIHGSMTLLNARDAERIYQAMGSARECSGGSAANTIAGLAAMGGKAAFIGKVRNDQLGHVFAHDIRAAGVHFATPATEMGPDTARCLVLVNPDAQRTMGTYLGASSGLTPADIDRDLLKQAEVVYLEGYLWDPPQAKEAFLLAMDMAHTFGGKVAFSLSDPFCVDRYRQDFRALAEKHIDILFANEEELKSLYEVKTFDEGLQAVRQYCEVAVLTRSAKGSVIVTSDEIHVIDAAPVAKVVDTTGAGDLYAAGFLYGYARNLPLALCGRLGAAAAAEIISHYGARPEADLKNLIEPLMADA